IDLERIPSERPVNLPLNFCHPAEHGLFTAETASGGIARAPLADELNGGALGMISGDGALDDLSAFRTNRHERRPSGAILLAQSRRDDRRDLAMLGQDK